MQSKHHTDDNDVLRSPVSELSGILRVLIGLVQGLLLYGLFYSWTEKAWLSTQPSLFVSLVMLAAFLPVTTISAIGHVTPRNLLIWLGALAVILCGLGYYDGWRTDLSQLLPSATTATGASDVNRTGSGLPSGTLYMLTVNGLYIAQALVLAGNADGKRIASYRSYFEIAWKLQVQLLFAALFTGLFWLVLGTGNALFSLIKLDFLNELTKKSWFNIPVTTLAFSFALHLSDVRPQIVAGIRKLLLTLLSWLLPMATLIVGGFLLSILTTGLEPLWHTRHASHVLLGAAGLLVLLINTVYQDGNHLQGTGQRFFTLCTRIACVLPTPLVLLAIYSLGLRVAEYGWTVSRIAGAVCALIVAMYAAGYAIAAISPRRDPQQNLQQISTTNVAASFAILLIFLALLSPLANPARIAVASQLQRLESGKVDAASFDYRFLRFGGERYGVQALQRLSQQKEGEHADTIRDQANLALNAKNAWDSQRTTPAARPDLVKNIRMHPADQQLPKEISDQDWRSVSNNWRIPQCMKSTGQTCDAYLVKPDPAAPDQLLIFEKNNMPSLFARSTGNASTTWQLVGKLSTSAACTEQLRQAADRGALNWQTPLQHDLSINGMRLRMQTEQDTTSDCTKTEAKK